MRAIILTGEGKHFSAGAELSSRTAIGEQPGGYQAHNRLVRAAFDVVLECPRPVLALVCDILAVAEDAYMAMTEVDFGFAGGVRHVLRCLSPPDARLMIYTARKVPLAVVAAKRSFGLTEEMPLRDGYRYEQTQTAALADSHDTQEALPAFKEKRKPVFTGR